MNYFYVLENRLGELYYGSTTDLKRRLNEHLGQKVLSTKGSEWTLIYYEAYRSEADAQTREKMVKHNGGTKQHLKRRIAESRLFES